jgi:hypothetical protein
MKDEEWHLDRRVPVSIIVTLLVQMSVGIWAFASLARDVETLKQRMMRQDEMIEATRVTANHQAIQLGRIEEYTRATQTSVERILARLERATP